MGKPFVDWIDTFRAWASNATNAELAEVLYALREEYEGRGMRLTWEAEIAGPAAPAEVE